MLDENCDIIITELKSGTPVQHTNTTINTKVSAQAYAQGAAPMSTTLDQISNRQGAGFSTSYVISGSRGTSEGDNLDGTYKMVVETCCDAPMYQRDGTDGPVLHRMGDSGCRTGHWCVKDHQSRTGNFPKCDDDRRAFYAIRILKGDQRPGAPDDDSAYMAWREMDKNEPFSDGIEGMSIRSIIDSEPAAAGSGQSMRLNVNNTEPVVAEPVVAEANAESTRLFQSMAVPRKSISPGKAIAEGVTAEGVTAKGVTTKER